MYVYGTGEPSIAISFIVAVIDPIPDCLIITLLTFLAYGWYVKALSFEDTDIYIPVGKL